MRTAQEHKTLLWKRLWDCNRTNENFLFDDILVMDL